MYLQKNRKKGDKEGWRVKERRRKEKGRVSINSQPGICVVGYTYI